MFQDLSRYFERILQDKFNAYEEISTWKRLMFFWNSFWSFWQAPKNLLKLNVLLVIWVEVKNIEPDTSNIRANLLFRIQRVFPKHLHINTFIDPLTPKLKELVTQFKLAELPWWLIFGEDKTLIISYKTMFHCRQRKRLRNSSSTKVF